MLWMARVCLGGIRYNREITGTQVSLSISLRLLLILHGLNGLGAAYALAHFLVPVVVAGPLLKRLREKEAAGPAGRCIS